MEKIINETIHPPVKRSAEQLIDQIREERDYGRNDDDQIIVCRPTDEDHDDWPEHPLEWPGGEYGHWEDKDVYIHVEGDGEFYIESELTLEDVENYFPDLDFEQYLLDTESEEFCQETEGRK